MFPGPNDTYFTVDEFAEMLGIARRTIENWAHDRANPFRFCHLGKTPLVSARMVENLIEGRSPNHSTDSEKALRLIGKG